MMQEDERDVQKAADEEVQVEMEQEAENTDHMTHLQLMPIEPGDDQIRNVRQECGGTRQEAYREAKRRNMLARVQAARYSDNADDALEALFDVVEAMLDN